VQCRITIGGNIGGTIIYKEAVLPLLLCDSYVTVAGSDKLRQVSIHEIFDKKLQLERGEFIVHFIIGREYLDLPFVHVKKTKNEKIDYPLISIAAIKKDSRIRIAISGVCSFPFRSAQVEAFLNDKSIPWDKRIDGIIVSMPAPVLNDISGSDSYRKFVLKNTLLDTLQALEGSK
jgi:CO/xanthine dehydrogenase FAD-binding subunit